MFCHNCGTALDDGAKFCPNCGTAVEQPLQPTVEPTVKEPVYEQPAAPVYQQPAAPVYQQPEAPVYREPVVTAAPVVNEEQNGLAKACLIFGIIGIAFSLSFYLSLLGIIFSAIGRGKVKAFLASGGELSGKAKVGNILSKLGLIFGIILFVLFIIWLIVIIVAAVNGSGYSSNVYWNY